ncbi:hypothetical protein RN001_001445 [Aquatica leii]|uniref:N-acetyltransferase domain-containing protein n=1 Tax=Aquatica leii TaxID=1421715 RepID=A0AAN7PFZ9_9COLE|nr:hypothetical protein RN001_001445 [Aquatica leii]
MDADLKVFPLHKHPQYKQECCNLINDEWKRSISARMRSLDSSSDKLPTNLILVKDMKVIGHCKISSIPSIKNGCFVESVVIDKALRGQGYGKYLMEKTEEYCKSVLNLKNIYLSTKGQETFYTKLGYNLCQPISIYGSSIPNSSIATQSRSINNILLKNRQNVNTNNTFPCPPPMPNSVYTENSKTYMRKTL